MALLWCIATELARRADHDYSINTLDVLDDTHCHVQPSSKNFVTWVEIFECIGLALSCSEVTGYAAIASCSTQ